MGAYRRRRPAEKGKKRRKQKGGFDGLFGFVDKIITAPLRIANAVGKQMKYRQYYKKHNQRGGFGFGLTYQPTDVTKFKDIKHLAKYFK